MADKVKCFQRIGWLSVIRPQDRRSTTMSEGAIFSSLEKLEAHTAWDKFHIYSVREVELEADDPEIDFHMCDNAEQIRRLEEWDRRRQARLKAGK